MSLPVRICLLLALAIATVSAVKDVPASWKPPGGLSPSETPQFILLTTDDDCNDRAAGYITAVTRKVKNDNNCTIPATFFCTTQLSTCASMKKLYKMGHEVGTHTKSHRDLHKLSSTEKKSEIVGARNYISSNCGIPKSQVVGFRAPFLSADAGVRKILKDNGFLYDASLPEYYNSPSSPSASKRLWPYSLYKGIKQMAACAWFGNIGYCSASERYSGLFELPMWMYQTASETPAASDLMDPANAYTVLKREFDRNYKANKAPVGIWVHAYSTGYFDKQKNRDEVLKFLKYATAKPNVWVVTVRQLIDWMQAPVPASKMKAFMSSYTCSKTGVY